MNSTQSTEDLSVVLHFVLVGGREDLECVAVVRNIHLAMAEIAQGFRGQVHWLEDLDQPGETLLAGIGEVTPDFVIGDIPGAALFRWEVLRRWEMEQVPFFRLDGKPMAVRVGGAPDGAELASGHGMSFVQVLGETIDRLRCMRFGWCAAFGPQHPWLRLLLGLEAMRAFVRVGRMEARLSVSPSILEAEEIVCYGNLAAWDSVLARLYLRQVALDKRSMDIKRHWRKCLMFNKWVGLLLVTLLALQTNIGSFLSAVSMGIMRWSVISTLVLGLALYGYIRFRDLDRLALDLRGLAELLRLDLVMRLAGVSRPLDDERARRLLGDSRWLLRCADVSQRTSDLKETTLKERLEWLWLHWVESQAQYFERAARREGRSSRRLGIVSKVCVVLSVVAVLAIQVIGSQSIADWVLAGAAWVLFVAAVAVQENSIMYPNEQVERFEAFARLFGSKSASLRLLLDRQNLESARSAIQELGELALVEQAFWLAGQRANPIELAKPG